MKGGCIEVPTLVCLFVCFFADRLNSGFRVDILKAQLLGLVLSCLGQNKYEYIPIKRMYIFSAMSTCS